MDSIVADTSPPDEFVLFGDESDDSVTNDVTFSQSSPSCASDFGDCKNDSAQRKDPIFSDSPVKKETNYSVLPVLWPEQLAPAFFSSMILTTQHLESVGGRRGYFAKTQIKAGTLLIEERNFLKWENDNDDLIGQGHEILLATLRDVLINPNSGLLLDFQCVFRLMKHWFPQSLEDIMPEVRAEGESKYKPGIMSILQELELYGHHKDLTYDCLLRAIFAMQFNGFASGLALHCSIFNHSCEPNCVKFNPTEPSKYSKSDFPFSQVRASREIEEGEQLTISYLHPQHQLRITRQYLLRKQFSFICKCELCTCEIQENELTAQSNGYYSTVEKQKLTEIERMLEDADMVDKAVAELALETALKIKSEALLSFPQDHAIFLRLYSIICRATRILVMQHLHSRKKCEFSIRSNSANAILFLRSSLEMLTLQLRYLGENHIDLATTYHDVSEGIKLILVQCPRTLFIQFKSSWTNFTEASKAEEVYRKEHLRIKALYS